jgi:hypothetical protein
VANGRNLAPVLAIPARQARTRDALNALAAAAEDGLTAPKGGYLLVLGGTLTRAEQTRIVNGLDPAQVVDRGREGFEFSGLIAGVWHVRMALPRTPLAEALAGRAGAR